MQDGPLANCGLCGIHGVMTPSIRPFQSDDADWVVTRHAEVYAADEGFDESFGVLVAKIVADFISDHDPRREAGWIAEHDGKRLGSIFCVAESADCAKLRLFFVESEARGTGLAQRMVETCMAFARDAGFSQMRLWTHESHRAAGRLYARNGFALTEAVPMRSFGQDVVSQIWIRAL